MVSKWKDKVSTPALVIDYDIMKKNIETMAKFARENNVLLRPHVKTHKCPLIGHMQLQAGASGICVAKVGEAEIFAQNGFDDILIANQVVEINQIKRLVDLNKYVKVRICVDSEKNIDDLNKNASKKNVKLEVLLDIDVGLGRNGVKPGGEHALKVANYIKDKSNLSLIGLLGYEGHLTPVVNHEVRKAQTEECMNMIIDTRDLLNNNGFSIDYLTASSSSTYMFSAKCKGITEIQPGTYIFSDSHLTKITNEFGVAATVLSTVCNHTGNREYTLDAGLKAVTDDKGKPSFKDFPKSRFRVFSEEHSQIKTNPNDTLRIGEKIEIIPSHICTTVNLYDHFTVLKDGEVIAKWDIIARGKNY